MSDAAQTRRDKLRRSMKKAGCDALLVTDVVNVTYLTGFTGDSSYLLVRKDGDVLFSDFRYTQQIEEECPGLDMEIRNRTTSLLDLLEKVVKKAGMQRLGIEADAVTVSLHGKITEKLSKLEVIATSGLVEELRMVKDRSEIAELRRAVDLAAKGFGVLRATLKPEKTEIQIRDELEYQIRCFGASDRGFPSIIAVGPRAALPHAVPTDRTVGSDNILLVDWGAKSGLYTSDLTRVLVTGKLTAKFERIYNIVLEAQKAAISAIRPGVTCEEVDTAARSVIENAGFGKKFGHGLGHGIGLQVHETPFMGKKCQTVMKPGMVVTVEPGIYLPGWGGVRIEDDVLVTRDGAEVLSEAVPKQLEDMVVA